MTGALRLLALPALLAAAATAVAGGHDDETRVATLTVRGEAELDKPADQLQLRVGVVTESPDATEALQENSARMDAVVTALKRAGLDATEYETGRFSIRPVYARRPRGAETDWQPKIIGYEVNNSLSVRTGKLDRAGELIEAANRAGANSIDAISFDLADPRAHRGEAITVATQNARTDAAILARAAGVTLVRVLSIQLDEAGRRPPSPFISRAEGMAAAAVPTPPIAPGDVTVRAGVTIVYEIAESARNRDPRSEIRDSR